MQTVWKQVGIYNFFTVHMRNIHVFSKIVSHPGSILKVEFIKEEIV